MTPREPGGTEQALILTPAGQDQGEHGYSWATARRSPSSWCREKAEALKLRRFWCVWLLVKWLRCQHRRVWLTCWAKFTLTSKWWTRQSHWNTASIPHPAPFPPLVKGCWGLGLGQEKSQKETSLRRNPELGLVINHSPAVNKLTKSNDFLPRKTTNSDSSCRKLP